MLRLRLGLIRKTRYQNESRIVIDVPIKNVLTPVGTCLSIFHMAIKPHIDADSTGVNIMATEISKPIPLGLPEHKIRRRQTHPIWNRIGKWWRKAYENDVPQTSPVTRTDIGGEPLVCDELAKLKELFFALQDFVKPHPGLIQILDNFNLNRIEVKPFKY